MYKCVHPHTYNKRKKNTNKYTENTISLFLFNQRRKLTPHTMLDYLSYYSVNVLALAASKTLGSGKKKKSSVKREPLTPLSNSEKMKVKKLQIKKKLAFLNKILCKP